MKSITKFLTFLSFVGLLVFAETQGALAFSFVNTNTANITNDVSAVANTGFNTLDGRGFISTGDASIFTRISNEVNQNNTIFNHFGFVPHHHYWMWNSWGF